MVDVWIPASKAARRALDLGADLSACLSAANDAAEKGAQATTDMRAARGRASKLGERAIGHLDPGAASAAIIIRTLLAAHIAQR